MQEAGSPGLQNQEAGCAPGKEEEAPTDDQRLRGMTNTAKLSSAMRMKHLPCLHLRTRVLREVPSPRLPGLQYPRTVVMSKAKRRKKHSHQRERK